MASSPQPSPRGPAPSNGHSASPVPANGQAVPGGMLYADGGAANGFSQLRETAGLLWQGKWIVLAVAVLVVAAVAAYTFSIPPEYQTSTLVLVERDQASATQGFGPEVRQSLGLRERTPLENELLVLRQSQAIARRVAGRLVQQRAQAGAGQQPSLLYDEEGAPRSRAQVAVRLDRHMRAYRAGPEVDAIRIQGLSTAPREAALVANTFAEEYMARTQETSRADLKGSRAFLEKQETKLQAELQAREEDIEQYMSREGATALDQESSRTVEQISTLQARRDEARIELRMKRSALQSLQDELGDIKANLAESASSEAGQELSSTLDQLTALNRRIEETYQEYPALRNGTSANETLNRNLERLKQQRARLRRQAESLSEERIDELLASGGVSLGGGGEGGGQGVSYLAQQQRQVTQRQIEISGLEGQLKALNQRLAEYRQRLKEIPRQSIELAQMQRARRSTEQLYTFIVQQLQEVRMAEESELGYAEVIRTAGVPVVPVRPNKRRNLMMGLFLGLFLGGALVLLRHRLDTRLHHPGDLRDRGHSVLGVIPDMERFIDEEFGGEEHVEVDGRTFSTRLPMLLGTASAPAEAYRRLRTNLQFSRPDQPIGTLLFTSSEQGEGKSTTAANLAIALAHADWRTALIDCDLHRPQVHRLFDLPREPGLTDVLFGQAEGDGVPAPAAPLATGIDNLFAMPAGSEVPKPAELLGSQKMRDFIERMRGEFDMVIFDSPPVLTLSDAMLLATQCDATALVALADETDERAFERAYETLDDVSAPIVGCVLNRFDPGASGYYYGYDYGYGYAFQHGRTEEYRDGDEATRKRKKRKTWF